MADKQHSLWNTVDLEKNSKPFNVSMTREEAYEAELKKMRKHAGAMLSD